MSLDIQTGGWCPKGRPAEDGEISRRYPLCETESVEYAARTRLNVRDSDATLILTIGPFDHGTRLTRQFVDLLGKPCGIVDFEDPHNSGPALDWLLDNRILKLNVAGPREKNAPGIYNQSYVWLRKLFRTWIMTWR